MVEKRLAIQTCSTPKDKRSSLAGRGHPGETRTHNRKDTQLSLSAKYITLQLSDKALCAPLTIRQVSRPPTRVPPPPSRTRWSHFTRPLETWRPHKWSGCTTFGQHCCHTERCYAVEHMSNLELVSIYAVYLWTQRFVHLRIARTPNAPDDGSQKAASAPVYSRHSPTRPIPQPKADR